MSIVSNVVFRIYVLTMERLRLECVKGYKIMLSKDTKDREPSIELLRIIAMLFIICSHYACHGQTVAQAIMNSDFVRGVY